MDRLNSGYRGYSMSNRACEAYKNGEKPFSKWRKAEIIAAIAEIDEEKAHLFDKVKLKTLKETVLYRSSWHHTSLLCNRTEFYAVDPEYVLNVSHEEIRALSGRVEAEKAEVKKYRGSITYLEWSGTRRHPKAHERTVEDIDIEERGSFYIISRDGIDLLRKKIGANGTRVINYEEQERKMREARERERKMREGSSIKALEHWDAIKDNCERSMSGHIYARGRKPSSYNYEMGLDKFFAKGEKRLYEEAMTGILRLEVWNGNEWISEEGI